MKLLAVDVETTGLDPSIDHILSIGLVVFDPMTYPSGDVATIELLVRPPTWPDIRGSLKALQMNAVLIERLSKELYVNTYENVSAAIADWPPWGEVSGICGKNYSSFDREFLRRLPNQRFKWSHRSIDPVSFFVESGDEKLPDLATCLKRANLPHTVSHNAIEDARQVAHLVSIGLREQWGIKHMD